MAKVKIIGSKPVKFEPGDVIVKADEQDRLRKFMILRSGGNKFTNEQCVVSVLDLDTFELNAVDDNFIKLSSLYKDVSIEIK